ncbi:MAG: phage tail tape measure protein [Atopobiaceae bacterium]|nr:phage tail tape measure protein [Atopobiaceae bacterium]
MAGSVFKGLTIELGADTKAFETALRQVNSAASQTQRELKKVEKALKVDPGNTAAAQRQIKLLGDSVQDIEKKIEVYKKGLADLDKQYAEGKISPEQYAEAHSKLVFELTEAEKQLESCKRKLAEVDSSYMQSTSKLANAGEKLTALGDKLEPIGEKMTAAGKKMTVGVTLPIVAAGTAAVKTAVDIDTALTGVKKTVDGTAEQYEALKQAAIDYSKTNAVSAEQVLNAQALGAQLGFNIDELAEFSRVATGMELATDMSLDDAATDMAQFANITKMAHEDIGRYASAIVNVGNNMATTESKVSAMGQRIAAAGTQVRMSQADIIGWSGVMSSLGIEAEAGGTAFSQFVSNIDAAVAKGGDDLEAYAKAAGMSAQEFQQSWQDSSTKTVQALLEGLAGADNITVALEEIGVSGVRQTDVLKRLAGNAELVADGLKLANDGWEENAALTNEVANRNESLAAKFEILKNRVIAVMEQIGAPLADALLSAIDAAEPLFEAIENGARAFSEMSDDEKRAIITTVGVIAALGPALTMFGKVTSSVKILGSALTGMSRLLANIDVHTGGAADGLKKVTDASGKTTTAVKASSVAMGALKGAAIGLAAVGIAVLIAAIVELYKHAETMNKATDGLRDSLDKLDEPIESIEGGYSAAGKSMSDFRREVDKTIESQAELADSISDSYGEVQQNATLAQTYADRIKEIQASYDGSAESAAALEAAVKGYNDATGSSISIIDKTTGQLDISTDALDRNTKAWIENAKAQAAQEAYNDIVKKGVELEGQREEAAKRVAKAEADLAEAASDPKRAGEVESLTTKYLAEKSALDELDAAIKANADSQAVARDQVERYTQQAAIASQTTDDFRNAVTNATGGMESFDAIAESIGINADDLAAKLSASGIAASDMASMGAEQFGRFYRAAKGDTDKVAAALKGLNAMGIDPKSVVVSDNGTITTAEGKVYDLNRMTIDGKFFSVSDMGTIGIAEDGVITLNGQRISDKSFAVNADMSPAQRTIDAFLRALSGIIGWIKVGTSTSGRAAGGISKTPIRMLAEGGIVTRPTLTNVGIVGEAGDEALLGNAIIPLSNRQHVRPFAQAVAAELGQSNISITTTVNAQTNADPQQIAAVTANRVRMVLAAKGRG